MGCSPEDLPEAMNDREKGERGSGISMLAEQHNDDDDKLEVFAPSFLCMESNAFKKSTKTLMLP